MARPPIKAANNQLAEIELLLHCSRVQLSSAADERVRALLRQPIDWELLLRLADRHGVRALLYWQLQEIGRETVPPDVWQGLQDHFLWNTQHKMLLAGELLALLKLFQGHGINQYFRQKSYLKN